MKVSLRFFLKRTFQFIVGDGARGGQPSLQQIYNPITLFFYSFIVCFFVIQLSLIGCDVIEMSSVKQRHILSRGWGGWNSVEGIIYYYFSL